MVKLIVIYRQVTYAPSNKGRQSTSSRCSKAGNMLLIEFLSFGALALQLILR